MKNAAARNCPEQAYEKKLRGLLEAAGSYLTVEDWNRAKLHPVAVLVFDAHQGNRDTTCVRRRQAVGLTPDRRLFESDVAATIGAANRVGVECLGRRAQRRTDGRADPVGYCAACLPSINLIYQFAYPQLNYARPTAIYRRSTAFFDRAQQSSTAVSSFLSPPSALSSIPHAL